MSDVLASTTAQTWRNAAAAAQTHAPRLSVLTPVYATDTSALLKALGKTRHIQDVELILLDDASPSPAPVQAIREVGATLALPITLIAAQENVGRAKARNRLIANAAGAYVLLLDADMIPDTDDFLDTWLALIEARTPAVAFGGFTVDQAPRLRETALHRFISLRSDCRDAEARNRDPAQFTTTSNLLVRKDVLLETPFDEAFSGWGWEDVEWALRVNARHPILHVDNTATHAGLDDEATLLRKAAQAGPNYRRLVEKHPGAVRGFRSYQAASRLAKAPGLRYGRPLLSAMVQWRLLPIPVRHIAYKLFRTLTYAEHLK